jgi:hypothetical protein
MRCLREELCSRYDLDEGVVDLSMGMSSDYELAVSYVIMLFRSKKDRIVCDWELPSLEQEIIIKEYQAI